MGTPADDIAMLLNDRAKPMWYFMMAVIAGATYVGSQTWDAFTLVTGVKTRLDSIEKVNKRQDAELVIRREFDKELTDDQHEALKVMFGRMDLNGEMAQHRMSDKKKAAYHDRISALRKKELEVIYSSSPRARR